ncbi:MAG: hypothetical protein AAF483_12165 [Planctomycetota bacterium]
MNRETTNLIGLLMIVAAVAVAVWSVFWPLPTPKPGPTQSKNIAAGQSVSLGKNEVAAGASAQVDWQRKLQSDKPQKTADVDQSKEPAKTNTQSDSKFRLVGTMVEQGNSFALVQDREGTMDLQPVGGELRLQPPGAMIENIESHLVVLMRGKNRTYLKLKAASVPGATQASEVDSESSASISNEMQDEEPEFSSLEEELDWLNGEFDEATDEMYDDMDSVTDDLKDAAMESAPPSQANPSKD